MVKKNQIDVNWHIDYAKKAENDPKRHKCHCVYYINKKCQNDRLIFYKKDCPGSSHCKYYENNDEKKKNLENQLIKERWSYNNLDTRANTVNNTTIFYGVKNIILDEL